MQNYLKRAVLFGYNRTKKDPERRSVMLDPFDYKEPGCPMADGKKFYYPSPDDPKGTIPVRRIIERLDAYFAVNDTKGAGDFLRRWEREAKELCDRRGEITIQNELMGYYRKEGMKDEAFAASERAVELIEAEGISDTVSAATVYLNAATVCKAFGRPSEALVLYEKTNRIYSEKLDPDDPLVAGLCNNSALALCDLGRYEEAQRLFTEAAAITTMREDSRCDEAITYVNMAHMYEAWHGNDSGESADCMETAWEILDSDTTARDSYYAFVAAKCAPSYRHFGYADRAKILDERSKEIYERS